MAENAKVKNKKAKVKNKVEKVMKEFKWNVHNSDGDDE